MGGVLRGAGAMNSNLFPNDHGGARGTAAQIAFGPGFGFGRRGYVFHASLGKQMQHMESNASHVLNLSSRLHVSDVEDPVSNIQPLVGYYQPHVSNVQPSVYNY